MKLSKQFENFSENHERVLRIRYKMAIPVMWVHSQMHDDHHDIDLYWEIDIPSKTVMELEGSMQRIPFTDCPNSLNILGKMIGLVIGPGVKREFRKRFERQDGCTHLTEIAHATFDFIMSRLYGPSSEKMNEAQAGERRRELALLLCQNNSCSIFNGENIPCFDHAGRYKGKNYTY